MKPRSLLFRQPARLEASGSKVQAYELKSIAGALALAPAGSRQGSVITFSLDLPKGLFMNETPKIGRYQIVIQTSGGCIFLLDNESGRTWRYGSGDWVPIKYREDAPPAPSPKQ